MLTDLFLALPGFLASTDLFGIQLDQVVWTDVLARLHPLVLHLPIGLLVVLALLELPRLIRRPAPTHDGSRSVIVGLLVLVAPLTAASGWFLNGDGEYGSPVEWHQRLGIAVAVVSVLIGLAYWRKSEHYPLLVLAGFLLLLPTAHLGATLTHGEDFLFEPWKAAMKDADKTPVREIENAGTGSLSDAVDPPAEEDSSTPTELVATDSDVVATPPIEEPPSSATFATYAMVAPIFEEYCTKCHGTRKRKGQLALHDLESIFAGSEYGSILIAGDPAESRLIQVLRLALDEDEHMPPSEKSQPTAEELDRIESWVAGLTSTKLPAPSAAQPKNATPIPEPSSSSTPPVDAVPSATPSTEPSSADTETESALATLPGNVNLAFAAPKSAVIEELRAQLIHVEARDPESNSPLLWLDFAAMSPAPGRIAEQLAPVAGVVGELSLFGQDLDAADFALLGALPRLARLDARRLAGDGVSASQLAALAKSKSLVQLNLAGTKLDANAAKTLAKIGTLERLYVWGTGLDEAAVASLQAARPTLEIVGASAPADAAVEVEPEVVFTKLAPVDPAPSESSAPKLLAAENDTCPVSKKPVDPRYAVVFDGRVIGFCCPNCPRTFWDEPAKYLALLDAE